MLVNLKMKNFKSIYNEQVLNFAATAKRPSWHSKPIETYFKKIKLLPVITLFGAHASGKSTILFALEYIKSLLSCPLTKTPYDCVPSTTIDEPTEIEISFWIEESIYTYNFAILDLEVMQESLKQTIFYPESNRSVTNILFKREKEDAPGLILRNSKNKYIQPYEWLTNHIVTLYQPNEKNYSLTSKQEVMAFNILKKIDIAAADVPNDLKKLRRLMEKGIDIEHVWSNSSRGCLQLTLLIIGMAKVMDIGGILYVDATSLNIHPSTMEYIVKQFCDQRNLKNKCQLLLETHQIRLMDMAELYYDQVYILQKTNWATKLKPLSDHNLPQKMRSNLNSEESLSNRYMRGDFEGLHHLFE